MLIGLLVGWAALTRPTEVISALIPVFWGVQFMAGLAGRLAFFKAHLSKMSLAVVVAGAVMFLQAAYWKYATGRMDCVQL